MDQEAVSEKLELSIGQALRIYFVTRPNDELLWKAYIKLCSPVLPFNWDSVSGEFTGITRWQVWQWIPSVILITFQLGRFIFETRHLIQSGELEDTFILIFWICAYSSTLVHLYNGIRNEHTFLKALRCWRDLKDGEVTAFTFLLRSLIPIGTITTICNCLLFLYLPTKPYFLFSLFDLKVRGPYFWILWSPIFLLYELMAGYIVFGIHVLHDAFLLGWVTTITASLNKISDACEIEGKHLSQTEIRGYRSIQIFTGIVNEAMRNVFFFSKLQSYIQISYVIVMVVSGLATMNVLNICYGLPQCISLTLRMSGFLREMSAMRSTSITLLEKWITVKINRRQYTERVVKSCRKVEYYAGHAYEIKKNTILTFSAGIMDQTLGILITLKSANLF